MGNSIPKATHEGQIDFGFVPIECANLDNDLRILSREGFLRIIGRAAKAPSRQNEVGDKLPPFLSAKNLEPFIDEDLRWATNPISYKPKKGGGKNGIAYGYRAELLPAVCKVYWRANRAGALRENQMHILERCEEILFALANVAIVALVDEATGYQEVRPKDGLQAMLKMYLQEDPNKWTRQFSEEFYVQVHRLKGWKYEPYKARRCPQVGTITVDIVYKRLQPTVWEELQKVNPNKKRFRYHQFLTRNVGNPHLKEHLRFVTDLMKVFPNWELFISALNRTRPICNEDIQMDIFIDLLIQSPEDFDRWKKLAS